MIAADSKDRHRKLAAFREQGLVLLSVTRERSELTTQRVVNGARFRIKRRVVVARLLVDTAWVRRQLIVEAIQQDALAPGDQPLDIRSAEIEVPHLGVG